MMDDIDELSQISLAYSISEYQQEARGYDHMRNIVLGVLLIITFLCGVIMGIYARLPRLFIMMGNRQ
jgi:hypothetical protein